MYHAHMHTHDTHSPAMTAVTVVKPFIAFLLFHSMAEFEQFLALRAQEGSALKPTRPRPQMQNPEDEEGPFAL